jgi:hypothetical protein
MRGGRLPGGALEIPPQFGNEHRDALRVSLAEVDALTRQVTSLQARGTELVEERRGLREASLLFIEVYGGAAPYPHDCENSETCLQCRADDLANEVLR